MTSTSAGAGSDLVVLYDIEDRSSLGEAAPLGIQHVLATPLGNVASPLILAGAVGSVSGQTTFLAQMALIVAGAATPVQVFPIGPVGARPPIIMGTGFAFLSLLIGTGQQFGITTVFGTSLPVAPVGLVTGATLDRFQKHFPPLVMGIVVMLIGLILIPTGMNYAAGASTGPSAAGYGSLANLGLAGLVLVVTAALNQFFDGLLRVISVFTGIVAGYAATIAFGMVDFIVVVTVGWITVPMSLRSGLEFLPSAVLTVAFSYVIIGLETIGDTFGTVSATDRNPTRKEFRSGLVTDAAISAFAALFSALPSMPFSQNVDLMSFTGAASRYAVGTDGVVLVVLGFVLKVDAVVSVMSDTVLGSGTLTLFAMIFLSGARIIAQNVTSDHRNSTILALSMTFGLGVASRPEVLQNFPAEVQTLFGSAFVIGSFTALTLNVVLPGGGAGPGPTEHTDGLDPEDPTELSSSESSPSAPVDD